VLAVVQHDQQLTIGKRQHKPRRRRGHVSFRNTQGLRDAGRDQRRIGERGKLDQPGTVAEASLSKRRHPQREAGLAASARAGQRDDPGRAKAFQHGSYYRATAHQ
jgi:hypothetical protein